MPRKFLMNEPGFHPFAELIGLHFEYCKNGTSRCHLEVNNRLLNPHHVLHGGVVYSMADTGMGGALYTRLEEDETCATLEIKISYFEAITSGNLTCDTLLVHKSKSLAALESKIENNNKLVAKALGTYTIFKAKEQGNNRG